MYERKGVGIGLVSKKDCIDTSIQELEKKTQKE